MAEPADLSRYADAIGHIESSNDYGQTTTTNTRAGDPQTAYGRYQVMGANIPEWTQAALGKSLTPQEYLADPQAQDAVFNHRFGTYVDKYGPEGAARAWFAGEGGMNNPSASDPLGTSVAAYAKKFNTYLGQPSDQPAPQGAVPGPAAAAPSLPPAPARPTTLGGQLGGLLGSAVAQLTGQPQAPAAPAVVAGAQPAQAPQMPAGASYGQGVLGGAAPMAAAPAPLQASPMQTARLPAALQQFLQEQQPGVPFDPSRLQALAQVRPRGVRIF